MALNAPGKGGGEGPKPKRKASLSSYGVSNTGGSSVGDPESKKRKLLRKIQKLTF